MNRPLRVCLVWLLLLPFGTGAFAFSMCPTRLSSPIHLHDGLVLFLQQDGCLTVLDARDGSVIRQEKAQGLVSVSRFASHAHDSSCGRDAERECVMDDWIAGVGVQSLSSFHLSRLFLLNPRSFEIRWLGTAGGRYLSVHGSRAIHAGRDVVGVTDLESGQALWQRRVAASQIEVVGERLFAFCGGWEGREGDEVVCFDIATGGELWRRTPAAGGGWEKMVVTESAVVLLTGVPGKDREAEAYRLDAFSLDGDALPGPRSDPVAPDKNDWSRSRYTFRLDGAEHRLSWIAYFSESPWRNLTREECRRLELAEYPQRGELLSGGGVLAISAVSFGERWASGALGSGYTGMGESEPPDRMYHFLDGEAAWTGRPGYLNLHRENFVDRAASGGDILVVATGHGQVECLERQTGRSRWIYLYPSRRKALTDPYEIKPALLVIGGYLHRLREYWRETDGTLVTGTVVAGDPYPPRFRTIVSPQTVSEYPSYAKTLLLSLGMLFFIPFFSLRTAAWRLPGILSRRSAALKTRLVLVVAALAADFLLHLATVPHISLFLETFAFCQFVLALSRGMEPPPEGGARPPIARATVVVLFSPFLIWSLFALVVIR